MIVKKIPARPAGRDATTERATHARNLVDYIRLPEKESAEKAYMINYMLTHKLGESEGERLFHIGARGFVSSTIEGQRAEMIAVAQHASRSPNPVDHWLLSWREDESPTPEQIDACVGIFLDHLGVGQQPCIYACHDDTHNRHVHIALNRYDPISRRMIEINDGFTLEAAHQAVALIVDRFGWQPERDARYQVVAGQPVLSASAMKRIEEAREPVVAKAAAYEARTGYRSAQRIAQEDALQRILVARSWAELHASLGQIGMTYDARGTNGVVIGIGEQKVSASRVDRSITRVRLERKLGPFEPRGAHVAVQLRGPDRNRLPDAIRAEEYRAWWDSWNTAQANKRAATRARKAAGSSPMMDALRVAALSRLQNSANTVTRPPPDLESCYRIWGEEELLRRWRNRASRSRGARLNLEDSQLANPPDEIDGFRGYRCMDGVRYARARDAPTAFLDRGTQVEIISSEDAALLGALRLAALKSGKVTVSGTAAARDRIFELASANGLADALIDPDFIARRRKIVPGLPPVAVLRADTDEATAPPCDAKPTNTLRAFLRGRPDKGSAASRDEQHDNHTETANIGRSQLALEHASSRAARSGMNFAERARTSGVGQQVVRSKGSADDIATYMISKGSNRER